MTNTVFVAGGTGKTGRRVVERLKHRAVPVRVGSRQAAVPFDWSVPATWAPALAGANLAYAAYAPDLAVPEAAAHIERFTEAALEAGVERIVLLSGRGEPEARDAERALLRLSPTSTVLRASWMDQNFSEGMFADMVRDGVVALPVGDIVEPFVDTGDIADAAVEVLLESGHEGCVHELTGPRPMSFAEAVREIAGASGRAVDFVGVPFDAFAAEAATAGAPAEVIELLQYLFTTLFDGRNASVGTGVRDILDREPTDFTEYAAGAAATGVWNP